MQTPSSDKLYQLLGELPARDLPIRAEIVETSTREHYRLQKLRLELNGEQSVPAYFTSPLEGAEQAPAVLFNHSHGGAYERGKEEYLHSCEYLQTPSYAEALSRAGYCGLCIDHWLFGERSGQAENEFCKEQLWRGRVPWGMMVYDSLRALDYLLEREEVDAARVATLGISMGSTMAWWLSALDTRLKVCVDLCCLTDFDALLETDGLRHHGLYYYVPGLLQHFSTTSINTLIAPRPHLALAGTEDPLTPIAGLERVDADLREVYTQAGAPEHWKLLTEAVGHEETPSMREAVLAWLEQHL